MMRWAAALLLLLTITACVGDRETEVEGEPPPGGRFQGSVIAELVAAAGNSDGRKVMVSGKVSTAVDSPGAGRTFMLDDGTGSILIFTEEAVPGDNQWVTVKGTIAAPFRLGDEQHEIAIVRSSVR